MATCPQCGTHYGTGQRLCPSDGSVLVPDQAPELQHVGKVLDGKYRLDAYLSRGGMGAVYRGTHVMLGRPVAVKLISSDLVTSPDMVRRFQREARAATHLNHPNIVKVYDLGQTDDGTLYIAMELVSGESLHSIIRASGALQPARIVNILGQIVSALALAHSNSIVHRDLKPHNIMISRTPDGRETATLLDFGIAKTFEIDANTKLTATGSTIGTPQYMSPEQASGQEVDGRSDLYSLGIILYEMLIGEVPFSGSSTPTVLVKHLTELPVHPSARRPDLHISPTLETLALRCLEKNPANRFQTADELAAELHRAPAEEVDADGATIHLSPTVMDRALSGDRPTVGSTIPSPLGAAGGWQPGNQTFATIPDGPAAPPRTAAPSRPTEPGTRPTAPALAPTPFVPPPIVVKPVVAPKRSLVLPVAGALVLAAAAGSAYWAMTTPADPEKPATNAISPEPVTAAPAPAPTTTPAGTEAAAPAPPPPAQVAPPSAPPQSVAAPRPVAPAPNPAAASSSGVISDTPLSRALIARVRSLASERGVATTGLAVALEMTTRPSGLGRGLTADYSATLRSSRGEKVFTGSHLGFAELPLRNEVVDKVADEIVRYLAPQP